tara:strand:- start:2205 stop:2867 length:663 start_codon:yes stop_codon:yes gene_type:complete
MPTASGKSFFWEEIDILWRTIDCDTRRVRVRGGSGREGVGWEEGSEMDSKIPCAASTHLEVALGLGGAREVDKLLLLEDVLRTHNGCGVGESTVLVPVWLMVNTFIASPVGAHVALAFLRHRSFIDARIDTIRVRWSGCSGLLVLNVLASASPISSTGAIVCAPPTPWRASGMPCIESACCMATLCAVWAGVAPASLRIDISLPDETDCCSPLAHRCPSL